MRRTSFLVFSTLLVALAAGSFAGAPQLVSYQGYLTDGDGMPVTGTPQVIFTIYDDATAGSVIWTETYLSLSVTDGHFDVLLGSIAQLDDADFSDTSRYLGIKVDADPEMTPRAQLVTVPFAFRTATVDGASGGKINGTVMVGADHSNTGTNNFIAGESCTTGGSWSTIGGGFNNNAGPNAATVAGGTTNRASANWAFVGAGQQNTASGLGSVVGGGTTNEAGNSWTFVGGGVSNTAFGLDAAVVGGQNNHASGEWSFVGGGADNDASHNYTTVSGGTNNDATGAYSTIAGGIQNLVSGQYSSILGGFADTVTSNHSYLFGINANLGQDSTFRVDMPHIQFGSAASGYEFPAADGSSGQVMATDGSGQLSWTSPGGGGGSNGWVDDGTTVRLETVTDDVGIGTTTPSGKLHAEGDGPYAGYFTTDHASDTTHVIHAEYTGSTANDAVAVYGKSEPQDFYGIGGKFESSYIGVEGISNPGGSNASYSYTGVSGRAFGGIATNIGMMGQAANCALAYGVWGSAQNGSSNTIGVIGDANLTSGTIATGVEGQAFGGSNANKGVNGVAGKPGANWNYGVMGQGQDAAIGNIGVFGACNTNTGWKRGVSGSAQGTGTNYGTYGSAQGGTTNYGVYGTVTGSGYAGYFDGDLHTTGTLSKAAGSFKIDHPLDPENKYLQHSFVESPDMMNIYNGNITTDADGMAVVTMPEYFSVLNKDFRYQLTVMGQFAQAIVLEKLADNSFTIKTDKPEVEVSWQVTGIRHDPYAQANRIEVEVNKPTSEIGTLMHPKLYGQPDSKKINGDEQRPQIKEAKRLELPAEKAQHSNK